MSFVSLYSNKIVLGQKYWVFIFLGGEHCSVDSFGIRQTIVQILVLSLHSCELRPVI